MVLWLKWSLGIQASSLEPVNGEFSRHNDFQANHDHSSDTFNLINEIPVAL